MFSELKKLFVDKEYRLFLVLVVWLLIGFTLFKFNRTLIFAYIVFIPLLAICLVLFFVALIFRRDLKAISVKRIVIYCIIAVIIGILFISIIGMIIFILFFLAIISYVLVTATFYMYGCYKYGVEWDAKVYNLKSPSNHILRWLIFLGGTAIAILITFFVSRFGISWATQSPAIADAFAWIAVIIMFLIIGLAIFGGLFILVGRLNAWLGIFFLLVAIYTAYLMFNAFFMISTGGDATYSLLIRVGLYIFDVFLILYTIDTILGEKVEVISEKLKYIKSDAILMWLIFSKAAFEFANLGIEEMEVGIFNAIAGFVLFVPLLFIAGFYGILHYGKMKKERKLEKSE